MKKHLSILALALGMTLSFAGYGQQKIGHIDAEKLLQMMPETKLAQEQIETYGRQLEKDMTDMEAELELKIQQFRRDDAMMTNLSRETRTREIQELQARIQEYGMKAQEELQNKQVELLTPIIEKATNAVKEVADEGKYSYILDSSQSKAVVIYQENGDDILEKVKKKLGITE